MDWHFPRKLTFQTHSRVNRKWLSGHDEGSSQSLATRRAKDGWMALDRRTGGVDHSTQPAAARPRGLAVAAPDERHALRARTANRCQLAACGWTRPRFPSLLLLARQPGTQ